MSAFTTPARVVRSAAAPAAASWKHFSAQCPIPAASAAERLFPDLVPPSAAAAATATGRKNVHWVFLGCPGVGKGTYAGLLSRFLGIPHIATGELVRDERAASGPRADELGEIIDHGKLVPDEIIVDLLSSHHKLNGESGFILDGFPRTVRQAEMLEGLTNIDRVINLKLREDALIAKCLGRRICSQCGGNYNVATIDIKGEGGKPDFYMAPLLAPSQCTSKLVRRSDDTEEVVKERLRVYHEMTEPVEEFYRLRGKLLEFDLPGGMPESWPKLLGALGLNQLIRNDDLHSNHKFETS